MLGEMHKRSPKQGGGGLFEVCPEIITFNKRWTLQCAAGCFSLDVLAVWGEDEPCLASVPCRLRD